MDARSIAAGLARPLVLGAVAGLVGGCAGLGVGSGAAPGHYTWFARPGERDPWSPKIAGWQSRERAVPGTGILEAPASVSGAAGMASDPAGADGPDLRSAYLAFRAERKRELARRTAAWIQEQARVHYVEDGPIDHWATLEGTLRRNGDDCDGLELLVNQALRDLGFSEGEIYRAIVYRPRDGQHHMVTLWFEDPDDPWVIDPTGAMTGGMPRMSSVDGWIPLKVFSEDEEYTVRRRTPGVSRAAVLGPAPAAPAESAGTDSARVAPAPVPPAPAR